MDNPGDERNKTSHEIVLRDDDQSGTGILVRLKSTDWFAVVRFTVLFWEKTPTPPACSVKAEGAKLVKLYLPGGIHRPSLAGMNAVHDPDVADDRGA